MKKQKIIKIALSVLITLSFFYFFFKDSTFNFSELADFNIKYFLVAIITYFIANIFRALRYHVVLNKELKLGYLYFTNLLAVFLGNIFPFKTGEFSIFYFLKKKNVGLKRGIISYSIVKIFDVFLLLAVTIYATSVIYFRSLYMGAYMAIGAIIAILLVSISPKIYKLFLWLVKKFGYQNQEKLTAFSNFKQLLFHHKKKVFSLAVFTILNWFFLFSSNQLLFWALGYKFDLSQIIIASSLSVLLTIIPISGFFGFGNFEYGMIPGLLYLGGELNGSLDLSFQIHLLTFILSLLTGLVAISYIFIPFIRRKILTVVSKRQKLGL
jgi:hypothetical protein